MFRLVVLLFSHGAALAVGFALGIYLLPILIAPDAPDAALLQSQAQGARYSGEFVRDLKGSDFLHWGEGKVSLTSSAIAHEGSLAPGPDYKLYLVKQFVENEDEFLPLKSSSALVGDVKTFKGFLLDIPDSVDIEEYTTVLVWCETFGEFITAAKYK